MIELIIDSYDRSEEAFNLLQESGIEVLLDPETENVCRVPDSSLSEVERILANNKIEFQWTDPEEFDDDYFDPDGEELPLDADDD